MTNTAAAHFQRVPSQHLETGDVVRLGDGTIARIAERPRSPYMGFYARATALRPDGSDGGTFTANLGLVTERRS